MPRLRPRAKVRLNLERGTAFLRQLGVTSVMCSIVDLSEAGCQCRVSLAGLDEEIAKAWRQLLAPGRILTIEMTEPRELLNLKFDEAELRWVRPGKEDTIDFGVLIKNVKPEQQNFLQQAMMTLAASKLRSKKSSGIGPSPEPSAAPADVPSPPVPFAAPKRDSTAKTQPVSAMKTQPVPLTGTQPAAPPAGVTATGRQKPAATRTTAAQPLDSSELPRLDASSLERQKRQVLVMAVSFQFHDPAGNLVGDESYQGRTIDFNEGGFQIEAPPPGFCSFRDLPARDVLMITTLKAMPRDVACKLRVKSIKSSDITSGQCMYGTQIVEMVDEDRRVLRELYIRTGLTMMIRRK
jgi:hypothetical protein